MKNELKKVMNIVSKFRNGEDITFKDILALAYTDVRNLSFEKREDVSSALMEVLENYGEEWSEYNDDYPNNTYRYGYILEDHVFVTGYSGVAGCYWYPDTGFICEG